eukprot:3539275-Rhodomonas_salina.1
MGAGRGGGLSQGVGAEEDAWVLGVGAEMENGYTALHVAALEGHAGAMKELLEAGADKKAKDRVSVDVWVGPRD